MGARPADVLPPDTDDTAERPPRLLSALRRNPSLLSEVATAHALAVIRARSGSRAWAPEGGSDPARLRGTVHRAARRSLWDGAVTGTSFVVGYPAALASLY